MPAAGHPSIFWDHYFENGYKDCIDQLIALRKRAGISGGSPIEILCADHDMYVARINDKCARLYDALLRNRLHATSSPVICVSLQTCPAFSCDSNLPESNSVALASCSLTIESL